MVLRGSATTVSKPYLSSRSIPVVNMVYRNDSPNNITECTYQFPLYDGVSVSKFTCYIGDEVLKGVVRAKEEAKAIFDKAVKRGETAGLFEQHEKASDVFRTSLGNIPAGEKVIVEIVHVGELMMEGGSGVKLTIPTSVAPRYGDPGETSTNSVAPSQDGLKITVDVSMWADMPIDAVTSPSHLIAVSIGTLSSGDGERGLNKASVTLSQGSTTLEKDFVLHVNVKDLGNPKAMLETHSTIPNHRALMVSLVPKFELPTHRPEIVFVVDRSGSMENNIPTLISAMNVFLKSLPLGIKFNICSFGSHYEFLWEKSQPYSKETLSEATQLIKGFDAEMGGTSTQKAVTATIQNRLLDLPLEVMLLTDGDIWQQEEFFAYINEEVKRSSGSVRIFPLGIGNGVSHALINGIARAGNGFPQTVQNGEKLDSSVVRMLRGALTPHISDYSMEVKYESDDDDFELIDKVTEGLDNLLSESEAKTPQTTAKISLFDPATKEDVSMPDIPPLELPQIRTPKIIQAPNRIPSLFSGSNTTIYLLLSPDTIQRNPTSVILRATSLQTPLELSIPIEVLSIKSNTIHELAARKATQDLEEGRGWITEAKSADGIYLKDQFASQLEAIVKREAVRLGEQFQIANRWCSFVALTVSSSVELSESYDEQPISADAAPSRRRGRVPQTTRPPGGRPMTRVPLTTKACRKSAPSIVEDELEEDEDQGFGLFEDLEEDELESDDDQGFALFDDDDPVVPQTQPTKKQKTSADNLENGKSRTHYAYPSLPPVDITLTEICSLGSQVAFKYSAMMHQPMVADARYVTREAQDIPDFTNLSAHDRVLALINCQDFEGTWDAADVEPILAFQIPVDTTDSGEAQKKSWVTMVVVCFLEEKMAAEKDTWELVVTKARTWLEQTLGTAFGGMEDKAKMLVESALSTKT
ncbi:von Willebrand domain-containing protein [Rutstroemia sp. NJR-2017a WRK4]|nr:von Willebrand domain-containing protein [Rutstroemia sp. NJR-2017a WRK4]